MKSPPVDWTKFILGAAVFLGMIVRFAPTLIAGFPVNDGGMFLVMIRDLGVSGYLLPQSTSYNFSEIPYAYPPLGFYLARLLADVGIHEFALLQFLPALASSVAIYGVYLFASAMIQSREVGALSALIYALAPRSYTWLVMGGGLTRALGFGFFIFAGWVVSQLLCNGSRRWLALSILFSILTVLSHPEATVHLISLCILLWLFWGRTRKSLLYAFPVASGTILLSAPWWGTLLVYHGTTPFLSVINTGMHGTAPWSTLWRVIFPNDSVLPILSLLFIVAFLWGIWKRQYFLLVWMVLPVIVEPRSALNVAAFPLSILLARLLFDLKEYFLHAEHPSKLFTARNMGLMFFTLILYLFAESYLFGFRLVNASLTSADRSAMQWVSENTSTDARFILLTGISAPELDAFQEWFPALAQRRSLTTFQGTEWTLGPRFFPWFRELKNLQACTDVDCLQVWLTKNSLSFDYILVRKKTSSADLVSSLKSDQRFHARYEDDAVVLFTLR